MAIQRLGWSGSHTKPESNYLYFDELLLLILVKVFDRKEKDNSILTM